MTDSSTTLQLLHDTDLTVADPLEDVRGMKVEDARGDKVGTVEDLLVDPNSGHVHFLRVEHGGILGFGATPAFVPVEVITGIESGTVTIDPSRADVAGAPGYDPQLAPKTFYGSVYGYYGVTPYWHEGYVHPGPLRRRPRQR